MQKRITIRFAVRPSQGTPSFNATAARHDLLAQLEPQLRERFGQDTEVEIIEGQTSDIRVDGRFTEKVSEVRAFVSEVLGDVMENFDSSGYA